MTTILLSNRGIHHLFSRSSSLKLATTKIQQQPLFVVSEISSRQHSSRCRLLSSILSNSSSSSSFSTTTATATTVDSTTTTTSSSSSSSSSSSDYDSTLMTTMNIRSLPWQFLRSADLSNFDSITHQRCDVPFDVHNGKVITNNTTKNNIDNDDVLSIQTISSSNQDYYDIIWSDGLKSQYSKSFIDKQVKDWKGMKTRSDGNNRYGRVFWNNLTEEDIRDSNNNMSIEFDELLFDDNGMNHALTSLYKYGILLVKGTPVGNNNDGRSNVNGNEAAVAALGATLSGGKIKKEMNSSLVANYRRQTNNNKDVMVLPQGTDGPLRTLYGTVWSTTTAGQAEGASVADSAYGNDGLPLHTDMTYMRDPPGLQIFTMVQKAMVGGESVFGDGFAIAQRLKEINPKAFDILRQTIRTYRCLDDVTGWNLQASGPVITVDQNKNDRIVSIRHNDLDRLPDLPPHDVVQSNTVDTFYKELKDAHQAWDELISSDEFRLVIQLQPGETMVVANQRCFHGRYSFQTSAEAPRSVMGCYISQDDLYSRFRMEGFNV